MIKHVVFWKFKSDTESEQAEFFAALESLRGKIEVLKSLEVYKNVNPDNDCDAALITTFASLEDLNAYKNDPRHLAASALCKEIRLARHAVDFEF
ncbi:MAG: Dabb family protein [Clostridia bacterium]|nr:Dabb family protein [Clostridia bacterium]